MEATVEEEGSEASWKTLRGEEGKERKGSREGKTSNLMRILAAGEKDLSERKLEMKETADEDASSDEGLVNCLLRWRQLFFFPSGLIPYMKMDRC